MLSNSVKTDCFCIFREPAEENLKCIFSDSFIPFSNFSEVPAGSFVVARFAGGGIYFTGDIRTIELNDIPPLTTGGEDKLPDDISHDGYILLIEKALASIEKGVLEKVVLSRTRSVKFPAGFNILNFYSDLSKKYPSAFVYLLKVGDEVWAGASPETLIHKEGPKVKTLSLAGTLKAGSGHFTEKERHEQQVVTDFIAEQLQPQVTGLQLEGPEELTAGPVRHLATHIQAELRDEDFFAGLMDNLPPTPAVSGLPRPAAMNFIRENEGYDRGFYAGYLGFHGGEESRFFVNLRCARFYKSNAVLYAGGGIVKGSDPQREWEETEQKMRVVGDLL